MVRGILKPPSTLDPAASTAGPRVAFSDGHPRPTSSHPPTAHDPSTTSPFAYLPPRIEAGADWDHDTNPFLSSSLATQSANPPLDLQVTPTASDTSAMFAPSHWDPYTSPTSPGIWENSYVTQQDPKGIVRTHSSVLHPNGHQPFSSSAGEQGGTLDNLISRVASRPSAPTTSQSPSTDGKQPSLWRRMFSRKNTQTPAQQSTATGADVSNSIDPDQLQQLLQYANALGYNDGHSASLPPNALYSTPSAGTVTNPQPSSQYSIGPTIFNPSQIQVPSSIVGSNIAPASPQVIRVPTATSAAASANGPSVVFTDKGIHMTFDVNGFTGSRRFETEEINGKKFAVTVRIEPTEDDNRVTLYQGKQETPTQLPSATALDTEMQAKTMAYWANTPNPSSAFTTRFKNQPLELLSLNGALTQDQVIKKIQSTRTMSEYVRDRYDMTTPSGQLDQAKLDLLSAFGAELSILGLADEAVESHLDSMATSQGVTPRYGALHYQDFNSRHDSVYTRISEYDQLMHSTAGPTLEQYKNNKQAFVNYGYTHFDDERFGKDPASLFAAMRKKKQDTDLLFSRFEDKYEHPELSGEDAQKKFTEILTSRIEDYHRKCSRLNGEPGFAESDQLLDSTEKALTDNKWIPKPSRQSWARWLIGR